MTEADVLAALQEAYRRAGTQSALAKCAGISQGRVADYLNGRYSVGNMSVSTLFKLFPEIRIDFFGESRGNPAADNIRAELLTIFDSLNMADQVHLLAMAAANFGENLKQPVEK